MQWPMDVDFVKYLSGKSSKLLKVKHHDILASTNYQNVVAPALLRATKTVQRDLELYFLNEGYYYDRRKNYYKNQGKPSSKIYSIQYTAQAIRAIIFSDPHTARSKPTALLRNNTIYEEIFNSQRNFKGYLNCCLITSKTNNYIVGIANRQQKGVIANLNCMLHGLLHISV